MLGLFDRGRRRIDDRDLSIAFGAPCGMRSLRSVERNALGQSLASPVELIEMDIDQL